MKNIKVLFSLLNRAPKIMALDLWRKQVVTKIVKTDLIVRFVGNRLSSLLPPILIEQEALAE